MKFITPLGTLVIATVSAFAYADQDTVPPHHPLQLCNEARYGQGDCNG